MIEKNGAKKSESSSRARLSQPGTSWCFHFFVCVKSYPLRVIIGLGLLDSTLNIIAGIEDHDCQGVPAHSIEMCVCTVCP